MEDPKISVIVPVYKVEPYLQKCLDSIVNQTYRNLEIILVDDGSPDSCGAICDEYATRDERIRVIHQENRGLAAARNAGLNIATGDYMGFVDSDDWIEADMFEYLLCATQAQGADIAICGRVEHVNGREVDVHAEDETLSGEQALEQLLENRVIFNNVWDKLWKKNLFETVRFPDGRNYEDLAVSYRLFEKAKRVVKCSQAKYHYLCRSGSILSVTSLKNRMDCYVAAKERYDDLVIRRPELARLAAKQCVAAAVSLWSIYCLNAKSEQEIYSEKMREIAIFCRRYRRTATFNSGLGITGKTIVHLTAHANRCSFFIASLCGWLYKWKHGRFP